MTRALRMRLTLSNGVHLVAWFSERRLALEWLASLPSDVGFDALSLTWENVHDYDREAS